jgi:hypothetical protein
MTDSHDALQRTLDRLSPLVARLLDAPDNAPLRRLVRAHVLAGLRLLDGVHKGVLLEFLYEGGLIGGFDDGPGAPVAPRILLGGADLRNADLHHRNLGRAHLAGVILNEADLQGAYLAGANLSGADLINTDLAGVDLSAANLVLADLTGANLAGATLIGAGVTPAQLEQAADISGIRLDAAF